MSLHLSSILCFFSLRRKEFELTDYHKSLLLSRVFKYSSSEDTPHFVRDTRALIVLNITNAFTKT